MADKKAKAKAKDKGKAKGKGAAKGGGGADVLRVASHPRAARSIRTLKGWGGLLCFLVTFWLSKKSGVPFYWCALRAVLGGMVGFVVVWACAVTTWRHLLVAQVEAARMAAMAAAADQAGPANQR
jgi:hypothetical protein